MTDPDSTGVRPDPSGSAAGANRPDAAVLFSLAIAGLFGSYLLLTSTTTLIPGLWPYDAKRILQFAMLFILFMGPALNGRIRSEFCNLLAFTPGWIKGVLLAVLFWGALSALLNAQSLMHGLNSLSEVALFTSLVLGVFVVASCRRIAGRNFDRLAIGMLAMTGLTVALQELLGALAAHNAGVDFNFRVSLLHFSWPRFYNQIQSWMVPALVTLPVLFVRNRLAYAICALVLGLQWYIILMTGARGSFLSIGAAIGFAVIFLQPVRKRLVVWQISGFILGALIYSVVLLSFESDSSQHFKMEPSKPSVTEDKSEALNNTQKQGQNSSFFKQSVGKPMTTTSGRIGMWRMTLQDVRDHPLIGIGPMNYACTSSKLIGHPHNFPLQLAAEWGIPAATAICLFAGILFWKTRRRILQNEYGNKEDKQVAGLLLTGVLAAGFHACLSGVLVMPASQVTGLLICGILFGLLAPLRTVVTEPQAPWKIIPGLFLTLILIGVGCTELRTMEARSELLDSSESQWPRMWQDSKVCRLYNRQTKFKN